MFTRIRLTLDQAELNALLKAADDELRSVPDQARFILRAELSRQGLLPAMNRLAFSPPASEQAARSKNSISQPAKG